MVRMSYVFVYFALSALEYFEEAVRQYAIIN